MKNIVTAVLALILLGCSEKPEIDVREVGNTAVVGWSPTGASAKTLQAITSQVEFALDLPLWAQYEQGDGSLPALKAVWKNRGDANVWNVGAFQTINTFHNQKTWYGQKKLEVGLEGYELFSVWRDVPVLCVSPKSPYKIIKQLTSAMLKKSRMYKVATSGPGSAGDTAMKAYAKANGLEEGVHFEFVVYDSGTEAALAVTGTDGPDIVTQNMSEESDLIAHGNLRPLMVFSPKVLKFKMAEPGDVLTIQPFNHMHDGKPLEFGVTFGVSVPIPDTQEGKERISRLRRKWATLNVDVRAAELGVVPHLASGQEAMDTVSTELEAVRWANSLP